MTAPHSVGTEPVLHEHRTIQVPPSRAALFRECYAQLGWIEEGDTQDDASAPTPRLVLRRDRRIGSRAELLVLQTRMEAALTAIDRLERGPARAVTVSSIVVGLVVVAATAGAVFAYLGGLLPLFVVLVVLAVSSGAALPLLRPRLLERRSAATAPAVDRWYEELYACCQHAAAIRSHR